MATRKRKRSKRDSEDGDKNYMGCKQNTIDHTERRATRSMTTDAARRAVFDTTELLENILVHLPMFEILRCQRVSHRFSDCIKDSTLIAEKLFRRSRNHTEVWTRTVSGTQTKFTRSSESVRAVIKQARSKLEPKISLARSTNPSISFIALPEVCPILGIPEDRKYYRGLEHSQRDRTYIKFSTRALQLIEDIINNPTIQYEAAKTYLSEAPVNAIYCYIPWRFGDIIGTSQFTICYDEPITLGDMVSAMLQAEYRRITKPWSTQVSDDSMGEMLAYHSEHNPKTGPGWKVSIRSYSWVELHGVLVPTAEERRLMKD